MRPSLALRFGFALALPGVPLASAAINADATMKPGTPLTAAQTEFFEKRIRPVLAEKCYKCHSADSEKVKGGLLLDTREGIREGGESGHAVVPGDTNQSLLLTALKWEDKDMRMPPEKSGGKLSDEVIAVLNTELQVVRSDLRVNAPIVGKHGGIPISRREDNG